jgi:hypothetical protein
MSHQAIPAPTPPDKHPIASVHGRKNSMLHGCTTDGSTETIDSKGRLARTRNRNVQMADAPVRQGSGWGQAR